jgi:hypothetical protein
MQATYKMALAFFALAIGAVPNSAWSADSVVGMWRVVSDTSEETESKAVHKFFGENPSGYIIFTAEGRYMLVITDSTRKPAAAPQATDAEAAQLWRTMFAVVGTYKIDGDKMTDFTEVSSNPALNGTEFSGTFEVKGDRLQYKSMPVLARSLGKQIVFTRIFERVK